MSKMHCICFLEFANVSHHVRQMDVNTKAKGECYDTSQWATSETIDLIYG